MKTITFEQIANALGSLIDKSLRSVEPNALSLLQNARITENNENAKWAIDAICENAKICASDKSYPCQDCGLALVFATVGNKLFIDCNLNDAINEGVRRGYASARKSVAHPLTRTNTGDNTPAVIYTELTTSDTLTLSFLAKGAGSENMSKTYMLTPSKGEEGIVSSVVDCVLSAGANPCPPLVLGVGVGGTLDKACYLSKKALLRNSGQPNPDKNVAILEQKILSAVNNTNVGIQGLGGSNTALAVHVETFPTHIGMLPVAVTIQCHSVRHGSIIL